MTLSDGHDDIMAFGTLDVSCVVPTIVNNAIFERSMGIDTNKSFRVPSNNYTRKGETRSSLGCS